MHFFREVCQKFEKFSDFPIFGSLTLVTITPFSAFNQQALDWMGLYLFLVKKVISHYLFHYYYFILTEHRIKKAIFN